MAKPTIGQTNWGQTLNDHLDSIESTANAAQPAATLDSAVAARVAIPDSETRAALNEAFVQAVMPEAFGAVGDGVADDTQAVKDAIAAGGVVHLTGKYKITSSLSVANGVCRGIHLAAGAELIKAFAAPSPAFKAYNALICNDNTLTASGSWTPIAGFQITGPGRIYNPDPVTYTGAIIALYADDLLLADFTIDAYNGKALLIAGDRMRLNGIVVKNPTADAGMAGVRFCGGTDFRASGCHIESGDDALQFNPLPPSNQESMPLDMPISNAVYFGCTGWSKFGRFAVAALDDTAANPNLATMTASITNSGFIGCKGKGTRRAALIQNSSSTGDLDVHLTDCEFDMSNGIGSGDTIRVTTDSLSGVTGAPVGALRAVLTRVGVINPDAVTDVIRVDGTSVKNVEYVGIIDCRLTGAPGSTDLVRAWRTDLVKITGGVYDMAGLAVGNSYGLVGGNSPTIGMGRFDVTGVDVLNVPSAVSSVGVYGLNVARGSLRNSRVTAAAGATAGRGVSLAAEALNFTVEGNDLIEAVSGSRIVDVSPSAIIRNNRGVNPKGSTSPPAVPASGVAQTNTTGFDCTVIVAGGTVSNILVGGVATGLTSGPIRVPARQTIAINYTAAPTWKWFAD